MDWTDAKYTAEIRAGAGQADVTHHLSNAPVLEDLIGRGNATWAVEVRCPKTLMAKIESSAEARHIVKWDADDVDGDVFIMPGLLARDNLRLDASGLTSLYQDIGDLRVPQGYWLARGYTCRASTLLQSLLSFRLDEGLKQGRMEVATDSSGGQLHFIVNMAPDAYRQALRDRTVMIAALVGVCAQFPQAFRSGDDDEELPLVRELRERLDSIRPGVTLWEDPANYDPAMVATLLEPFRPTPVAEGSDSE